MDFAIFVFNFSKLEQTMPYQKKILKKSGKETKEAKKKKEKKIKKFKNNIQSSYSCHLSLNCLKNL